MRGRSSHSYLASHGLVAFDSIRLLGYPLKSGNIMPPLFAVLLWVGREANS